MSEGPRGSTRVAGVIGQPITHSRSPAILNAAFAATGLDWVFVAFEVGEAGVPATLDAMLTLGLGGLSVTMPDKTVVADLLAARDDGALTESARRLRAVNCIAPRDGVLIGHNTDGPGFVASLQADAGFDPAGRACVVLGAGGAARALVLALADAGAGAVTVVNRTAEAAEVAAALAGAVGRVGTVADLRGADLVVNATSVGMDGVSLPVAAEHLAPTQLVADIVVTPAHTPLLGAAQARGAATLDGFGMLAHQAAVAFELWTGQEAPVSTMVAAARRG